MRRLGEFWGGWFVGNFEPTLVPSSECEVALKRFAKGDTEPMHHQVQATEVTVIISGRCRIGAYELGPDDVIRIAPREAADFEALTDVVLVAVKYPSLPEDKRLGAPE